MEFTHFDENGNAVMVDVSEKAVTKRVAVAKGSIRMSRECFDKIKYQDMKNVLFPNRQANSRNVTNRLFPDCHCIEIYSQTTPGFGTKCYKLYR